MTKYIKLEELMKFPIRRNRYNKEHGNDFVSGIEMVLEYAKNIPAADVAPVWHGRWIDGDPYCPICRKDKFIGLDADVWSDWQPDYCPNCGAKMDGEPNE